MTKHFNHDINLHIADEGYGTFYDPDLGYDLEVMTEDEDLDFSVIQEIENDTAARLSQSYNLLLTVPHEILFSPTFRSWILDAATHFRGGENE